MILPSNLKVSLHILPSCGYLKARFAKEEEQFRKKEEQLRVKDHDLPLLLDYPLPSYLEISHCSE